MQWNIQRYFKKFEPNGIKISCELIFLKILFIWKVNLIEKESERSSSYSHPRWPQQSELSWPKASSSIPASHVGEGSEALGFSPLLPQARSRAESQVEQLGLGLAAICDAGTVGEGPAYSATAPALCVFSEGPSCNSAMWSNRGDMR